MKLELTDRQFMKLKEVLEKIAEETHTKDFDFNFMTILACALELLEQVHEVRKIFS